MKRSYPITDPCGIPQWTSFISDCVWWRSTYWLWPNKSYFNKSRDTPCTPYYLSLLTSVLWSKPSNALERSRYMLIGVSLLFITSMLQSMSSYVASSVDRFGINPYCCDDNNVLNLKYSSKCECITIFDIGRIDIGR